MTPASLPQGPERGNWAGVAAATLAGVAAALHIGKAAAALPLIREEFGTSLTLLSVYVSLISLIGAIGGIAFGRVARRLGPRKVGLTGLALVALGSAASALSPGIGSLMAARLIEAAGFACIVTTMPALTQAQVVPADRGTALGIWAMWMPLGVALMMGISWFGLGPLGWRGVYLLCAVLPVLAAFLLAATARETRAADAPAGGTPSAAGLLRDPRILRTAGIFAGFSAANMVIMAFLPTILVDRFAFSPAAAALVGFTAALALLPTNILGGRLTGAGGSPGLLLVLSLSGMLVASAVLLLPGFPPAASVIAAIACGFCSGMPPGVIWGMIPRLVRSPSEAPLLSGAFFQAAATGQVAGPPARGNRCRHRRLGRRLRCHRPAARHRNHAGVAPRTPLKPVRTSRLSLRRCRRPSTSLMYRK